jgi:hypothetical protein
MTKGKMRRDTGEEGTLEYLEFMASDMFTEGVAVLRRVGWIQ